MTPEQADEKIGRLLLMQAERMGAEYMRRFTIEQCALAVERTLDPDVNTRIPAEQMPMVVHAAKAVRALATPSSRPDRGGST